MTVYKMFSRSIVYTLILSILSGIVSVPVFSENTNVTENVSEPASFTYPEYEILKYIGALDGFEEYSAEAFITKGEFLKLLMRSTGLDDSVWQGDEIYFYDVKKDSVFFSVVSSAYAQGIIQGRHDGTLGVDDKLTVEEAVVMALRATGYEEIANAAGGYPTGFNTVAIKAGLLDNVETLDSDLLTFDSSIILLYNMLNIDLVKMYSNGAYKIGEGKNFISSVFNIYVTEGIVEGNGFSNIYTGMRNDKSELTVNGVQYKTDERYLQKYIGYNAKIHYKDNEDERFIIYLDVRKNNVKELDVGDVITINPNGILYYDNKERSISLADDVITIHNGQVVKLLEGGLSIPLNGSLELIDNDCNGEYDIINLLSYEVVVVNDVSMSDGIVYDKYSSLKTVDTKKYETVDICFDDGKEAVFSDIKKNSVLFVYADNDFDYIRIIISDKTASFKVVKVSLKSNKSNEYYEVTDMEGNIYKTGIEFKTNEGDDAVKAGTTYEFLLDAHGKIASIKSSVLNEEMKFGYLCKWAESKGIKNGVSLKVFTEENKFEIFETEKKINVGSAGGKVTAEALLGLIKKPQLIRYRTAENNIIKEIEFASNDEKKDGLRKICTVPNGGLSYNNRYYAATGLIGGRVLVNGETSIFVVPDDEEIDNEEKYSFKPCTYITNEWYYPGAEAYTTLRDSVMASVVVIKNQKPALKRSSPVMLVKSIGEYYDADSGKTGIMIYGFQAGNDVSFKCAEGVNTFADIGNEAKVNVEPGDAVRLILDDDGYIAEFKLMFDESTKTVYGVNNGDDSAIMYGSEMRHLYGKAYKVYDNYLKIKRSGDTVPMDELFPITGSTRIYEVDMEDNGDKRFRIIGKNDIITLSSDSNLADNIFIHTQFEVTSLIVIYK